MRMVWIAMKVMHLDVAASVINCKGGCPFADSPYGYLSEVTFLVLFHMVEVSLFIVSEICLHGVEVVNHETTVAHGTTGGTNGAHIPCIVCSSRSSKRCVVSSLVFLSMEGSYDVKSTRYTTKVRIFQIMLQIS